MRISMDAIRRRADGSIDTDFYVAIGQREQAKAVRGVLARLFRRPADRQVRHDRPAAANT